MTHSIDMKQFGFGNGAFLKKGTPMVFEMDNCTPTYVVRALDGLMQRELDEKGIDFDELMMKFNTVEVTVFEESGEPKLDDDGRPVTFKKREIAETKAEWIKRTIDKWKLLAKLLIESFRDLKRADGSMIECNEETIEAHGGFDEFMMGLVKAARIAAQIESKNSDSSPDGKSDEQAETGDDTSQPAQEIK